MQPGLPRGHGIHALQDLSRAVLLQQTTRPTQWADWLAQAGADGQQALRGPRFEQFAMIAQAAVSSLGAALLPRFLVQTEIDSGRWSSCFR